MAIISDYLTGSDNATLERRSKTPSSKRVKKNRFHALMCVSWRSRPFYSHSPNIRWHTSCDANWCWGNSFLPEFSVTGRSSHPIYALYFSLCVVHIWWKLPFFYLLFRSVIFLFPSRRHSLHAGGYKHVREKLVTRRSKRINKNVSKTIFQVSFHKKEGHEWKGVGSCGTRWKTWIESLLRRQ